MLNILVVILSGFRFIWVYSEGPCGRYGAHPIEHQQMGGWEVLLDALPPLWIIQANMLSYEQISTKNGIHVCAC